MERREVEGEKEEEQTDVKVFRFEKFSSEENFSKKSLILRILNFLMPNNLKVYKNCKKIDIIAKIVFKFQKASKILH